MRNEKLAAVLGSSLMTAAVLATAAPVAGQVTALDEEPPAESGTTKESLDPSIWGEIDLPIHWRPFNPIIGAGNHAASEPGCAVEPQTT